MKDSRENKDDKKCCMCQKNQITHFLVNKRILNNQRLLCAECYHNNRGREYSISYENALSDAEEIQKQKDYQRKSIADQQIKSIKILLQLLDSYKDDLIDEINNVISWVNEWIRIIEKIKKDHTKNNSSNEIYSLLYPNYIEDQIEVLMFKHRIKYCNFKFCNKLLLKIQNFSNTSKLQEGYQYLIDALFSIEQKIETKPAELLEALKDKICLLHQEPITRVQYQDLQNPIVILCNSCDNRQGQSLENFSKNWYTFLKNKEGRLEKLNQFLRDKIQHYNSIQIKNQATINYLINKGIFNLVQTGANELQKQCNEIEELKKMEQDLKIESMITKMLEFNNQFNKQNNQIHQNVTNLNPFIQIDKILNEQIEKNSKFLNQESNLVDVNFDLTLSGPIQWRLVSQCENENCTVIAFNYTKQLLITNQGNKINIYQLKNPTQENQLKNLSWERKLQVHKQNNELSVTCIMHSKQYNAFVTSDEKLVIWKYCDKIDVCEQLTIDKQNGYINCLIVNKNETQLFSGGQEIQVYHLNFEAYDLKYEYSLQEHQGKVLSLSLNDSETYLISYGEDQQIIVRFKREEKWISKQQLKASIQECSNRISFIKNDLFILVIDLKTDKSNIISFFKKTGSEDSFQEQVQEQLQIKYQSEDVRKNLDQPGFPIIQLLYNNLIFIKNRNYIYSMRYQLDGLYEISQKIMEFSSSSIFGNALYIPQKNECYLVIWDQKLKTYKIMF